MEWLSGSGADIDAAGPQQPYRKAYGDVKILWRQQERQRTTVQDVRQGARAPVSYSSSTRYLTFHTDHARMTTADVDQVELAAGYIWFCCKCLKAEVQIGNSRVRSLLDSGLEFNLIREHTVQ